MVERDGEIVGYTTGVAFFGHSVTEANEAVERGVSVRLAEVVDRRSSTADGTLRSGREAGVCGIEDPTR